MTLEEALAASAANDTLINEVFEIDPNERTIDVPEDEEILGVYQDRNVERKYFTCPRYVGDMTDLSECTFYVNYTALSGTTGQYLVDDLAADDDDVTFSWLLSGNVFDTNEDGTVEFAVQAKDGDGNTVFDTRPAEGQVYATIEAPDYADEDSGYTDVIEQILSKIGSLESEALSEDTVRQYVEDYMEENPYELDEDAVTAVIKAYLEENGISASIDEDAVNALIKEYLESLTAGDEEVEEMLSEIYGEED